MPSFTQFDGPPSREVCDVVVGFDFGTSCSKVIVRTPFHYNSRACAVPFPGFGHPSCNYLLPSVLWIDDKGCTSLRSMSGGKLFRDIKYHLARREPVRCVNGNHGGDAFDSRIVAVAFLAHALRAARAWFINQQRELYSKYRLRWTFNIGLPSEDFADQELCDTYQAVANAAWRLSLASREITLGDAEHSLGMSEAFHDLNETDVADVHRIPEVAAEVAGYARSFLRNEGLHILIDIGASTLDVCGFILHEREGDDRYELLTADVKPLGAMILYQDRVQGVRVAVDAHMEHLWNKYDPVSPMPNELGLYTPSSDAIGRSIDAHNERYKNRCFKRIWRTIIDLKTKRDPKSDRWKSDLPVFVSGGGSAMPFYQAAIEELSVRLHQFYHDCRGVRPLSLPKPENLVADIDEGVYHRLAVAWGLSYPETDIGEVARPGDIDDIEPPEVLNWQEGFISKDMV